MSTSWYTFPTITQKLLNEKVSQWILIDTTAQIWLIVRPKTNVLG